MFFVLVTANKGDRSRNDNLELCAYINCYDMTEYTVRCVTPEIIVLVRVDCGSIPRSIGVLNYASLWRGTLRMPGDISWPLGPQQQTRGSGGGMRRTDERTPDSCIDPAPHTMRAVPTSEASVLSVRSSYAVARCRVGTEQHNYSYLAIIARCLQNAYQTYFHIDMPCSNKWVNIIRV